MNTIIIAIIIISISLALFTHVWLQQELRFRLHFSSFCYFFLVSHLCMQIYPCIL